MTAAVESGEVASRMEALGAGVADLVHRYWNWCLEFCVSCLVFGIGVWYLMFGIWCLELVFGRDF